MPENATNERWTVDSFELINVVPVDKMFAVYAVPHPTQKEKFCLEKSPIHFIGIAKVTTHFWTRNEQTKRAVSLGNEPEGTRVVGIDLCEGYFSVCDEADNFAGLMKDGDDIDNAIGCLSSSYPLANQEQAT